MPNDLHQSALNHTLQRRFNSRILSMIALGGSIGTGIFLASGNSFSIAGPGGTLLAYSIMGMMVYYLMTSLGEMASFMPNAGSFYFYAAKFVDPALGYALGWNYWYNWAITIASEIVASSLIMQFWFPGSPPMLWCSIFLSLIVFLNIISARFFGEAEYWLSCIKVSAIILFIIAGFAIILGFTNYQAIGFKNWFIGDAPFHNGFQGIMGAFMIAGFSFQGTELIGIAAGESDSPEKNIPKAVNMVFWRILLFFLLALFVISLLIPYTSRQLMTSDIMTSPFTLVFQHYNKALAALFMNAIILIAILSTANSGMYAASRILWYLAKEKHVPAIFSRINHRGIPIFALAATATVAMLAFLSSLFGNGLVYFWLLNAGSLSGFIAWMGIAISHYRFRKAYLLQGRDLRALPYVAKWYPYGPVCAFAMCLFIIMGLNYEALMKEQIDLYGLLISYSGLPLFLCLWLGNKWVNKTKVVNLAECHFDQDLL